MGVRIMDRRNASNVIALRANQTREEVYEGSGVDQLGQSIVRTLAEYQPAVTDRCAPDALTMRPPLPEPAQLYGLTVLAFLLHVPAPFVQLCLRCGTDWPCEHVRLAYRLREGF